MQALMDDVEVRHTETGTDVVLERSLGTGRHDPARAIVEERRGDSPVARIEGEIDASNVVWIGDAAARDAQQPARGAGRRPHGDDLHRQRRDRRCCSGSRAELDERQQQLRLVVASAPRSRAWSIVGLERAIPTFATRAGALEGL